MTEIPSFRVMNWSRIRGRGWLATVKCDRERPRDNSGLLGPVLLNDEPFECIGVERFLILHPIRKDEVIGILVKEVAK